MSARDVDALVATMRARTRRVQWLWGLGVAWLTRLISGLVALRLWVR